MVCLLYSYDRLYLDIIKDWRSIVEDPNSEIVEINFNNGKSPMEGQACGFKTVKNDSQTMTHSIYRYIQPITSYLQKEERYQSRVIHQVRHLQRQVQYHQAKDLKIC